MSLDLGETDGTLYKWTNYWGGWQPRWFALKDGILAYYSCFDEINKGCKASLNVSAGEVKVHSTDNTRFDIILQNDQHWYLRASTPKQRQKWLIALGTVKARKCEYGTAMEKESAEVKNKIQSKVSELRLYCDLLSHQVVQLKEEAETEPPDVKKLTETSSMLVATCNTFLDTLTQCMSMTENNLLVASHSRRSPSGACFNLSRSHRKEKHSQRSISVDESPLVSKYQTKDLAAHISALPDSYSAPTSPGSDLKSPPLGDADILMRLKIISTPIPSVKRADTRNTHSPVDTHSETTDTTSFQSQPTYRKVEKQTVHGGLLNNNHEKNGNVFKDSCEGCQLTFFTAMLHSFTDIILEEDGGVPTTSFLCACENVLPFFDAIGSTAFAPVKMDIAGNIKKIRTKQESDPTQFCTLQSIIAIEMNSNSSKVRNSATDALLWLKRALRFIQKLLSQLTNGEKNMTAALNESYASTLKKFHSWVVKGIFALALKAAPYYDDFVRALATESLLAEHPDFIPTLMRDMDDYVTALEVVLSILDNFYMQHSLEDNAIV